MKETLKLKNPIEINGKPVQDLTYDVDAITAARFAEASAKKMKAAGGGGVTGGAAELDFTLHMYLGFAAIIACNPEYDYMDLERISGKDLNAVMQIGRDFFIDADGQPESDSEEPSETTPESTTQA